MSSKTVFTIFNANSRFFHDSEDVAPNAKGGLSLEWEYLHDQDMDVPGCSGSLHRSLRNQ